MTKSLVILEIANNHFGDFNHASLIIDTFSNLILDYKNILDFAFKFQFRDLDTFIHPDYKNRLDLKYIKRFSETKLTIIEFEKLKEKIENYKIKTICTAFDEQSVRLIEEMKFDFIKVASCSFTDWLLLNEIVKTNLPIIASTGGASLEEIDNVVSFFIHRNKNLSLMHCVGEYPTKSENLQLNQIDLLRKRYNLRVGFSTHESPQELDAVKVAIAKGVEILEKHIGINTEKYTNNNYTILPEQFILWLESIKKALLVCGSNERQTNEQELKDLSRFRRGAYLKKDVKNGELIKREDLFCAFPLQENQISANNLSKYTFFVAQDDLLQNAPLLKDKIEQKNEREQLWKIIQNIKKFLVRSKVTFPGKASLEISHHYGIEKFYQFGITMLTVVNREYCKKIIIVLPYQEHPEQYHKIKEETFVILFGELNVFIDGKEQKMRKGDILTIEKNQKHRFNTTIGCIIEELSTTHSISDSFYTDNNIDNNQHRKTIVNYWFD